MSAIASKDLQDIDVLVEKVAAATGLSSKSISNQLEAANINAFRFNDMILISPDDFDSIIDGWADSIKEQLAIKPSSRKTSAAPAEVDEDDSIEEAPASSGKLAWPKGYEKVVTHLYTPTLKKILPANAAQKKQYLRAIADETKAGNKLAEQLAKTIVSQSKRNLAYDKVLAGLRSKCADLLKKG